MGKLLVVNAGSSSMKFKVFEQEGLVSLAEGLVERIGIDGGKFIIEYNGTEDEVSQDFKDHGDAVNLLKVKLIDLGILNSLEDLKGIGHRVVQGGEIFKTSSLVGQKELEQISELSKLAPLHNPGASAVIKAFFEAAPNAKNVAVFDTSYHQTMPETSFMYAVPREWYEKYGVRRYGAHGTSHKYMAEVVEETLGKKGVNVISCHLGNGASITAIKDSKSFNTSMGLTPLAGIAMGTRSGDIDPSVVEYMVNESGLTVKEVTSKLNKESGMLALSGVSSDFRDIKAEIDKGNERAITSLEIYAKRVADYIVQYQNDLDNNVDAIVFTAGIGENAFFVREAVINRVKTMKVALNKEVNETRSKDKVVKISDDSSEVPVFVIKTDEELVIARDLVEFASL